MLYAFSTSFLSKDLVLYTHKHRSSFMQNSSIPIYWDNTCAFHYILIRTERIYSFMTAI